MFTRITASSLKCSSILAGSLFLAACGGGGGGSSSLTTPPEAQVELLPGVYATEIVFPDESSVDAVTLLDPSGEYVVLVNFGDITVGALQFQNDGSISGNGTDYVFNDSWQTQSGTLSGEVLSARQATITATAEGFGANSTLERGDLYSDLGVTLEDLSGTYTMSAVGLSVTSVTVSVDGTITGSDETGCVFNGSVAIPDPQYNVYNVSYTAANCEDSQRNGEFTGLGAYDPDLAEVQFAGVNGEVAGIFIGAK